jgi:hypothetical protein
MEPDTGIESMVRLASSTNGLAYPIIRLASGSTVSYQNCIGIGYLMPRFNLIFVNSEPDTDSMIRLASGNDTEMY